MKIKQDNDVTDRMGVSMLKLKQSFYNLSGQVRFVIKTR